MISEVPLGAFLSGGVDSSAVVAMMAGLSADPVNTCSIAFDDPAFDESRYAQQVADRYRTRHFVERVETRRLRPDRHAGAALRRAVRRQLGDPDLPRLPAGAQARDGGAVRRRRRRELRRLSPLPAAPDAKSGCAPRCRSGCAGRCSALLGRALSQGRLGAARVPRASRPSRRSRATRSRPISTACRSCATTCGSALFSAAASSSGSAGYSAVEVFQRHARRAGTDDPLALIQYLDLKTYLVGDINTKVDRASMAHSLEVREPLMDHPLVEWLATLPSHAEAARQARASTCSRRRMEPHLPHDILYRPKMGFAVPLARWFRGPLRERVRSAVLGRRARRAPACSTALPASGSSTTTSPAGATTARRCGRC